MCLSFYSLFKSVSPAPETPAFINQSFIHRNWYPQFRETREPPTQTKIAIRIALASCSFSSPGLSSRPFVSLRVHSFALFFNYSSDYSLITCWHTCSLLSIRKDNRFKISDCLNYVILKYLLLAPNQNLFLQYFHSLSISHNPLFISRKKGRATIIVLSRRYHHASTKSASHSITFLAVLAHFKSIKISILFIHLWW